MSSNKEKLDGHNKVDEDVQIKKKKPPGLFNPVSRRFQVLMLIMIGYFALVYMRANLGLAMTCMVNSTAILLRKMENGSMDQLNENFTLSLPTQIETNITEGSCAANQLTKKTVVNDYGKLKAGFSLPSFYGALISLIPAGIASDFFSPRLLLSISAITSILSAATLPYLASNFGPTAVFISMFLSGIGEGLIMPAINKLVCSWIPTVELSRAASIYTTANQLAGFIGFPISALMCASSWKWPSIFYLCDTPETCRYMLKSERIYLDANLRQNKRKETAERQTNKHVKIPYWQMFTSLPLWALIFCTFTSNMIVVLIQVYLPLFFKEVLLLSMKYNGLFSAAPNISQFVVKMGWSVIMDKLKDKKLLSPNSACKLSQGFSSFSVALLFVLLSLFGSCDQPYVALGLLCAITMCFSTAISGFYTSLLSLAPLYTGTLTSIVMLSGYLGRLITPQLVPFFNKTGALEEWSMVFYSMAITTILSGIFFLVFGSGNAQKWGLPREREPTHPSLPEIKIDSELVEKLNSQEQVNEEIDEEMEQLMQLRRASHVGSVVLDLLD
ncbi:MFS domain-containing protein [Aphelenchoides bicaudatus]|nr:MFS domain-containing protein [Aphelenchoides bicaudatus]